MKNLSFLVYLFFLLQLGCAWNPYRNPAAKEVVSIDDVLTIKKSEANLNEESFLKNFEAHKPGTFALTYEESDLLDEKVAFKFQVENSKSGKSLKLLYSKEAFKDPVAYSDLINFIQNIAWNKQFTTPFSLHEAIYNAENGDPVALSNLLKIKADKSTLDLLKAPADIEDMTSRLDEYSKKNEALLPLIKQLNKERKEKEAARKAIMDTLDKASDDKQLKSLIANNDRKGVVQLLKKYLPFEQMPPFEKRFWDMQLDIIEHPVDLKDRVFIYRGLADDFIHQAVVDGQEVGKDTALRDGKAFLMSTVLVKNQGSWNRRLRSLQAMYEKWIGTDGKNSSEFTQSARITTMLKKHSGDPKGSPFLSFTPRFTVAKDFGSHRLAGFLVDPRIISFNFTSGFEREKEFLMPLMTFPDEMVGMWDKGIHTDLANDAIEVHLKNQMLSHLEEKYGKNQAKKIMDSILKRSEGFFSPVYTQNDKALDKIFSGALKSDTDDVLEKGAKVKPSSASSGNKKTCIDMVKIFWAIP